MKELTLLYVKGGERIGYGRLGVYLAEKLIERGYTVYDDDGNPNPQPTAWDQLSTGLRSRATTPTNLMCLVSIPGHLQGFFEGQHRSIVTMWEAMTLPEAFRENFHEFDTIIVPSEQNRELFSRYHSNVQVMLLGVDPKLWHYIPPTPPEREFRFLISGLGTRKGVDLAHRAFREVFRGVEGGPAPRLIMKSRNGHTGLYGDGVEHLTGLLSPQQERDLYASAHCYVQPSRGEGFGLQPLQALALGRPTILTDAHGHESYAHLGVGIGWDPVKADDFAYGDGGMWWEPKYDELCEAMWDVYKNWETHAETAAASAEVIAKEWTWENVTDRFVEIHGEHMESPYLGTGTWRESSRNLFPIITNRDYRADIAGRTLIFKKGKEYYEPADVKARMFDGNILDPACIDDAGQGLRPQQVEEIGAYRAKDEVCPACGQIANSGITAADIIEQQMIDEEG